jgi:hypothetical protein
MKKHLLCAALAALTMLPAHALTFEGAQTQGGTHVTTYSGTGLLSFDIDFANLQPVQLAFLVEAEDLLQPIAFNAVLRNFSGSGIGGFQFTLDRGTFGPAGSVTRQFEGSAQVSVQGGVATLQFSSLEFLDVEIGNALGTTPGATDWTLTGLQAGDRLNFSVSAVPEPGTWALLLAGLGAVGGLVRRRRQG